MQKESFVLRICDFLSKYSIYALVFLVPIFFLPWTTEVLDFNKQALLLFLVFISLFALMLKILITGKFEINKTRVNTIAGIFFLVSLCATIFSVYRYGSFWGQSQQASESLLTIVCLLLFYFLVSNIFSKKDILKSVIVFSISALVAELIGVLQLFGLFIMPFDFAKSAVFNMIGSVGSLGIFAALILPLATLMLVVSKKWKRILFAVEIALSALIIILINYPIIWIVVIAGSALTLLLGILKRDIFDGRWMVLPMFFLTLSLFFVFLSPQINWSSQKPNEIFLSQRAGLQIAGSALKARPIFGSGLGTFAYDFSRFKNSDFSKTSLWNITFNKSSSKVLNSLATTGVLGFLAMLALMVMPVLYGIKSLIAKKEIVDVPEPEKSDNQIYSVLLLGLLVVLVELSVAFFLYNSNITLDFIYFFTIAALVSLISKEKKEYLLKSSSLLNLIVIFAFTLVLIFGAGLLVLNGQRYLAEVNYYNGLVAYQTGKTDDGLKKLESAASLNPDSDLYFRQLSQAYLLGLQTEIQNTKTTPTDQEKAKIQTLIANSINAGKIATDLNSQDVNNWSWRGYVYQSLFGISTDASTWAINSYDSALKLDPNNPYLFFQEGSVYLAQAVTLSADKADQKSQLLAKAQTQLERAVSLNPNYSNALYALGIVYDALGQKDKAITAFTTLQQLNPTNTSIPTILSNLKAGRSALQVTTPPTETPSTGASGTVENPPAKTTTPSTTKTTPKTK